MDLLGAGLPYGGLLPAAVGGQILIAVTVEELYLSVSDVQAMDLGQMEQQKIAKMTEGGT